VDEAVFAEAVGAFRDAPPEVGRHVAAHGRCARARLGEPHEVFEVLVVVQFRTLVGGEAGVLFQAQ
jgi:hypothetical protein